MLLLLLLKQFQGHLDGSTRCRASINISTGTALNILALAGMRPRKNFPRYSVFSRSSRSSRPLQLLRRRRSCLRRWLRLRLLVLLLRPRRPILLRRLMRPRRPSLAAISSSCNH